jgi:hypothetical protein
VSYEVSQANGHGALGIYEPHSDDPAAVWTEVSYLLR